MNIWSSSPVLKSFFLLKWKVLVGNYSHDWGVEDLLGSKFIWWVPKVQTISFCWSKYCNVVSSASSAFSSLSIEVCISSLLCWVALDIWISPLGLGLHSTLPTHGVVSSCLLMTWMPTCCKDRKELQDDNSMSYFLVITEKNSGKARPRYNNDTSLFSKSG